MKKRKTGKGARKANAAGGQGSDLEAVFDELEGILSAYAPPFRVKSGGVKGKRDFHLVVPKPVVIPGAYGGKPVDWALASLIGQKGYVGFYFMCVYGNLGAKRKIAPVLMNLLKGKSCFHVKALTPELVEAVREAMEIGVEVYREKGWVYGGSQY